MVKKMYKFDCNKIITVNIAKCKNETEIAEEVEKELLIAIEDDTFEIYDDNGRVLFDIVVSKYMNGRLNHFPIDTIDFEIIEEINHSPEHVEAEVKVYWFTINPKNLFI